MQAVGNAATAAQIALCGSADRAASGPMETCATTDAAAAAAAEVSTAALQQLLAARQEAATATAQQAGVQPMVQRQQHAIDNAQRQFHLQRPQHQQHHLQMQQQHSQQLASQQQQQEETAHVHTEVDDTSMQTAASKSKRGKAAATATTGKKRARGVSVDPAAGAVAAILPPPPTAAAVGSSSTRKGGSKAPVPRKVAPAAQAVMPPAAVVTAVATAAIETDEAVAAAATLGQSAAILGPATVIGGGAGVSTRRRAVSGGGSGGNSSDGGAAAATTAAAAGNHLQAQQHKRQQSIIWGPPMAMDGAGSSSAAAIDAAAVAAGMRSSNGSSAAWQQQQLAGLGLYGAYGSVDGDEGLGYNDGDDSGGDDTGLTVQEKNRTAQRRFRQRQKQKMVSLELAVSRLSGHLGVVTRENSSLRHVNTMLEKVLTLRDEHIAALQEALRIFTRAGAGIGSTNAAAAAAAAYAGHWGQATTAAATSAAPGYKAGNDQQHEQQDSEDSATAATNTLMKPSTTAAANAGTTTGAAAADAGNAGGVEVSSSVRKAEVASNTAAPTAAAAYVAVAVDDPAPLPLRADVVSNALAPEFTPLTADRGYTAEVVARMSVEDVMAEYNHLVLKVRESLAAWEAPDGDPAALNIVEATMKQVGALSERVAMYKPRAIRHLLIHNCVTGETTQLEPQHWRDVVSGIFLDARQVSELLAARDRFLADLHSLLQQRAKLASQLATSAQPQSSTHVDILSASLLALDSYEELKANVLAEHRAHMGFIVLMFKKVMSAMQVARAMCLSYPYYPDPLAITNVLQEQQQAADHAAVPASLMQAGIHAL
eukprot:GHRR01001053.1.p1 GENE.GHRR01001053.1~~GHRR01001053.1.p1  ORF type:complete len:872 (+),score=449.60 GHRR01001053.1:145-2616(+)